MTSNDSVLAGASFGVERAVQAFPLGGPTKAPMIPAGQLFSLDGVIAPATSLFIMRVPDGATLYVGVASQLASLSLADARAVMFPLDPGYWTVTLTDAGQAELRLLAPDGAPFTLRLIEALTTNGGA